MTKEQAIKFKQDRLIYLNRRLEEVCKFLETNSTNQLFINRHDELVSKILEVESFVI